MPFTLPYLLSSWVDAEQVASEKSLVVRVGGVVRVAGFFGIWAIIFPAGDFRENLGDNRKLDGIAG
ncbi:hypothetical protein [Microcoleus asticus]|uniref:hypothetical protein n=1 Tax=Microcoleus asticus TaxID=2815231 RepID=UPI00155364EF|nr:hypothetical protein [Microcoleus asticus]